MKQVTNCKNCGAALDIWKPHCEFCGTKNINLTALDLKSREPANFIFKLPSNIKVAGKEVGDIYLSLLAIPSLETVTTTSESVTIYGGYGDSPLASYNSHNSLDMQLKLTAVNQRQNDQEVLCTLRYGDE